MRDLGFTGKAAIHPKQLGADKLRVHAGAERIAYASKVIQAFETRRTASSWSTAS